MADRQVFLGTAEWRSFANTVPQIKNAVRSAHAIASSDGTHLCYSHLETVLEVGK
jgi:hypothetical protein